MLLAGLYGFVVFGVANLLFDLQVTVRAQVALSAATGLAGLVFQQPIVWFSKFTNRLFYRDAYDPQDLFGELNRTLVSTLNIADLMRRSMSIVDKYLKSGFSTVGLRSSTHGHRFFGDTEVVLDRQEAALIGAGAARVPKNVIIVDQLEGREWSELRAVLDKNSVTLVIRLSPDVQKTDEGLGYILLGQKKSGDVYNRQDLRVLDTVAKELVIAIQNALHFEEIQQFNVTLQTRIEEATRQLQRTNRKLEMLDETKDDFISMASHQLRTPLTSVKGYISMILDGDGGKITNLQKKMLGQAFISSQRMVFLISDLLNVSRLKTGKFMIDAAPTNLAKMVREEVGQLVEAAAGRSIELTYDKPIDFPELMLDETKTRQVVMNFIDNAIYYTRPGGHITVKLIDKPASVELCVVDDGIGVPHAEQHHLFTKFYRARNARRVRPDGTGLGLFMAKKVILAEGGTVIFRSREDQGSTFGFSLPKARLLVRPSSSRPPQALRKLRKVPG